MASRDEVRGELLSALRALLRGALEPSPLAASHDKRRLSRQKWLVLEDVRVDGRRVVVAIEDVNRAPTARERQVLQRHHAGETYKEIAYALGVSHSTVRVLMTRVRRRLGVAPTPIEPARPIAEGDEPRASPC